MKALLFSDTHADDYSCQLPVILATGHSFDAQNICEAFSDELALYMEDWDECTFHLWGTDRDTVAGPDISFAEVVELFLTRDTHELSVDMPARGNIPAYTNNWAIRDVPEPPEED